MDQGTRDKVKKLPTWARELIQRLEIRAEPRDTEIQTLLRRVSYAEDRAKKLHSRNEAIQELLECAARGGHVTAIEAAKAVSEVMEIYRVDLESSNPVV